MCIFFELILLDSINGYSSLCTCVIESRLQIESFAENNSVIKITEKPTIFPILFIFQYRKYLYAEPEGLFGQDFHLVGVGLNAVHAGLGDALDAAAMTKPASAFADGGGESVGAGGKFALFCRVDRSKVGQAPRLELSSAGGLDRTGRRSAPRYRIWLGHLPR